MSYKNHSYTITNNISKASNFIVLMELEVVFCMFILMLITISQYFILNNKKTEPLISLAFPMQY